MATYLENLTTRRDAVAAELAALDSTKPGGKPDQTGEGVNPGHMGYKKSLLDELDRYDKLIEKAASQEAADGGSVGFFETFEIL